MPLIRVLRVFLVLPLLFNTAIPRQLEQVQVVENTIVHIDTRNNSIWWRYRVSNSVLTTPVLATADSNGDRRQFIYTEGSSGMIFESIFHPTYYFCTDPATSLPEMRQDSISLNCQWVPYHKSNGNSKLQNNLNNLCLNVAGDTIKANEPCNTASRVKIVPSFPCDSVENYNLWYNGLGLNISEGKWINLLDTGNDINIPTDTALYAPERSGHKGLEGYTNMSITFAPKIPDTVWTILAVGRYGSDVDQNAIIQCKTGDCGIGWFNTEPGVLQIDGTWITADKGWGNQKKIICFAAKNDEFKLNGYQRTIYGNTNLETNEQFCINCNGQTDTYSHFRLYEVVFALNDILLSDDCWTNYFDNKYGLDIASFSPTPSPTHAPTQSPTMPPSTYPSNVPSNVPSIMPSLSPTTSPISICADYNQFSDDGNIDNNLFNYVDYIDMSWYNNTASTVIFDANSYVDSVINCNSNQNCLIKCENIDSCLRMNLNIDSSNSNSVALYCNEEYSCSGSDINTISMITNIDIDIICSGQYSCINMRININNASSLNVYCVAYASCLDLKVNINAASSSNINVTASSNDGMIQCISQNSCDNVLITTNSVKTQLILHQYSEDVVLDNGVGYLYEDDNILCNTNRFIRYETSENVTDNYITNLISSEYDNGMLPCSDVTVKCGNSTCNTQYFIKEGQLETLKTTLLTGCYWMNIEVIQRIECIGACLSSPSKPPTSAPSFSPTDPSASPTMLPSFAPFQAPSGAPSSNPIIAPSIFPSISPSNTPTMPPTLVPSNNPSITPTLVPSIYPSNVPTNVPSFAPSISPTLIPSIAPSFSPLDVPSVSPTIIPSLNPSYIPSTAPSAIPSLTPSNVPTTAPTISPTESPTKGPTRYPTGNIDEIYKNYIDITYYIDDLNLYWIGLLEDDTEIQIPKIITIIERNYLNEDIEYRDFMIDVLDINGFDDLSNINLKEGKSVELNCKILSIKEISGVLILKSQDTEFEDDVSDDLQSDYFMNTTDFEFHVGDPESLEAKDTENIVVEEDPDYTILYISIVIVCIGALITIIAKILNKKKNYWVDNAKAITALLFSLQIYDFISDINLSYDIFNHNDIEYSIFNLVFLCGIASITFTVLPYLSNLAYGIKIKDQKVIKKNQRATTYFTDKIAMFIGLIVICGGCYPALLLVSSRLFAMEIFNCGLTKHELSRLAKIKIKTTISMENAPQLLIQIIYVAATSDVTPAVFLAFIGSVLSVIMAISSFYANKVSRKDEDVISYYLLFTEMNNSNISQSQKKRISHQKGRKEHLEKLVASEFKISRENIEFGYAKTITYGLEYHVLHYIPSAELNKYNMEYNRKYNKQYQNGYMIDIKPEKYLTELYKQHKSGINDIFRAYFQSKNVYFNTFTVSFMIDHSNQNMANNALILNPSSSNKNKKRQRTSILLDDDSEGNGQLTISEKKNIDKKSSQVELQEMLVNITKNMDFMMKAMKLGNKNENLIRDNIGYNELIVDDENDDIIEYNDNKDDIAMSTNNNNKINDNHNNK